MGDIAEMILNGDMDCETGEWLGGGEGFPRTAGSNNFRSHPPAFPKGYHGGRKAKDTKCPQCGKKVRGAAGLKDHTKDAH